MIETKHRQDSKKDSLKSYLYLSLPSIIMASLLTLTILFFFRILPSKLPLFYSLPWGDPQLVVTQQFYILPLSILLITLLNLIILLKLDPSYEFFKRILVFSTIVATIILVTTFIQIVSIFI